MEKETSKKEVNMKKVGLIAAATAGVTGTAVLGVLLYLKTKDCNELKELNKRLFMDIDIYKEAWEGLSLKCKDQEETAELVRTVVGGPLIDRLIKNEEKIVTRFLNNKDKILNNGLDELSKKALEDLDDRIQNSIETIADFKKVKDALKRD